jgi:hypothetical protein
VSQAPDIAPKDGKVSSYIYLTCLIFRFFFSVRSLKNNPGRSTPGCSHASGSPGYKRDGKKDGYNRDLTTLVLNKLAPRIVPKPNPLIL